MPPYISDNSVLLLCTYLAFGRMIWGILENIRVSVFDFCHCGRPKFTMLLGGGFQSICTNTWRALTGLQNARWLAEPFGFAPDCVSLHCDLHGTSKK